MAAFSKMVGIGKATSWLVTLALMGMLSINAEEARGDTPSGKSVPQTMREDLKTDADNTASPLGGTGSYPALVEVDERLQSHVIYRPGDLASLDGKKLGVVIWGNGACTDDGTSARLELEEIASHGYIVVAPGRILSGPGAQKVAPRPMSTNATSMIWGLDWLLAQNKIKESRYFGLIDENAIAVAGHSCGGILSLQLSGDPRIKTVLVHYSGIFPNRVERPQLITDKAWLQQRLHTPVIYFIGNETDVAHDVALDDFTRINHVPVFLGEQDVGHQGTFQSPNGGSTAQVAVSWLEWQLRGDPVAAERFVGPDCGLCREPNWKILKKGL